FHNLTLSTWTTRRKEPSSSGPPGILETQSPHHSMLSWRGTVGSSPSPEERKPDNWTATPTQDLSADGDGACEQLGNETVGCDLAMEVRPRGKRISASYRSEHEFPLEPLLRNTKQASQPVPNSPARLSGKYRKPVSLINEIPLWQETATRRQSLDTKSRSISSVRIGKDRPFHADEMRDTLQQ